MNTQKSTDPQFSTLIENIVDLIKKGNAHVSLDDAVKNIPFALLGEKPEHLPYSIWQIVEHIRIAQWDILEFSRNAKHVSPQWPDGYWPKDAAPKSKDAWNKCIGQIHADRKSFIELIKNAGNNLYEPFEYGTGQSLLKEALVLADHNSYHTGEIIIVRRLLNAWNK
ncbi:DinB family protein [Ginsengibacter hankyongi]|uniref:DinB family protein n=1 Tax=Ginsengibacter hankyongi TaxID=2607284 RepID=A0A5J5IFK2_9BACT|nr:DinB family protein [Ginsengibacter hankyongi]KAA9039090.1 DinB family protein [Ginsengibacter hankyongi]